MGNVSSEKEQNLKITNKVQIYRIDQIKKAIKLDFDLSIFMIHKLFKEMFEMALVNMRKDGTFSYRVDCIMGFHEEIFNHENILYNMYGYHRDELGVFLMKEINKQIAKNPEKYRGITFTIGYDESVRPDYCIGVYNVTVKG